MIIVNQLSKLFQANYQISLIIYLKSTAKSAKGVKKERKKIKLVCDFIGLKDNKLQYKCNECKKKDGKHLLAG